MPYKTPFGKHYHEKFGCKGAFISCGTGSLEPCSICCSNVPRRAQPINDEGDAAGEETIAAGSNLSQATLSSAAPQVRVQHDNLSDLATRYAEVRRRFEGQALPTEREEGNPSVSSDQSQEIPPEVLVKRFEATYSQESLANDWDGSIRYQLVQQIEEQARTYEFRYQTAQYRSAAQKAWNDQHPEAKILEWSHKDSDYSGDGPRGVVYIHYDKDWSLNYHSSCTIMDKATGENMNERIFACYAETEWWLTKFERFKVSVIGRIDLESGGDRLFDAWLEKKYKKTHNKKYRPQETKRYSGLAQEFEEETHHFDQLWRDLDSGAIQYTDEENRERMRLYSRYEQSVERLTQMMTEYGIEDFGDAREDWRVSECLLKIQKDFPYWEQYLKEHPISE